MLQPTTVFSISLSGKLASRNKHCPEVKRVAVICTEYPVSVSCAQPARYAGSQSQSAVLSSPFHYMVSITFGIINFRIRPITPTLLAQACQGPCSNSHNVPSSPTDRCLSYSLSRTVPG